MPFLAEERPIGSGKPRSPSPPVRRSLSTDRGALTRSRVKPDTVDNPPITRLQFPARGSVNKSAATIPFIPTAENIKKGYFGPQDNISDTLYSLQRVNSRKVQPEHEEEQFKPALNVRQGGIRKTKNESKVKHQVPAKVQKPDPAVTLASDVGSATTDETQKSDFSEPENEHATVRSPVHGILRVKKLHQNFSRNSQHVEPRYEKIDNLFSSKLG